MGTTYVKATLETGTYGSGGGAPSASDDAIKITSFEKGTDRGVDKEETTDSYVYNAAYGGALKVDGTIEANWRPTAMSPLLEALMGANSAGTYTLDEPKACVLQFGEDIGSTTRASDIYGVGISSVDFTFEAKEYVKTSWKYIGADLVESTYDTSLSFASEAPLLFWGASLTIGATTIYSKSCTLTIDRALDEEQFVLGSFKRYRLTRTGVTDINGTLTFTEDQMDEMKRAEYGTTSGTAVPATNDLGSGTLLITCLRPTGAAGAVFTLPITYTVANTSHSGVGEIEKTVDYTVVGTGMQIVVS